VKLATLAPVFLGSLARRRTATLFSFAAIVLGVALGMAVQAVHEAALAEFGRGLRSMAGEADLQVLGPRGGFDEKLYVRLAARPEVAAASPIVEVSARLAGRDDTVQLLGVDVFALPRTTPALLPRPAAGSDRFATLTEDRIFLSAAAQAALGVKASDALQLQAGTRLLDLTVAGDLPGAADNERLAVMDIAAVQNDYAQLGRLTRIDLRLAAGVQPAVARTALQAILPAGTVIEEPTQAENQAANLSRAYRVNLTMLAAMALLTGGFLVFSAQALSVVRRRTEFAFLRAIGLARRQLFAWLVAEGALVGLAGGIVGAALGHALAWATLAVLGGDLGAGYFAGLKPQLQFQPGVAAIYVALGMLAGIAGAWLPAREAATVTPAQALKAGDDSALLGGHRHPKLGVGVLAASLAACLIPPLADLPVGGYLAVACLLAGSVMLLPAVASIMARVLPKYGPVPARLAAARLGAAPGHAVVAAAGVLTSVALAAAMAIMVASFRNSVDQWLHQILPADLYLRAGAVVRASGFLDPELQARIAAVPGVGRVDFTRHDSVRLGNGTAAAAPVALIARPVSADGHELPLVGTARTGTDPSVPSIWISEAMHDLHGWRPGQNVELPLAGRPVRVYVAGVWRDYSRQSGAVLIDLDAYRRLTGDRLANDAAISLADGAPAARVADALVATAPAGTLQIAWPGEIRAVSLRIFDRTFAVTYLLEAVAVIIGLAGVAASFAALAAARRREFGMLRHLGLTRRQIGWMLAQEGALAAGVGVLGGLVAGAAIGLVLIEVVNRQSFHWSMDLALPWASLAVFAGGLIALASLAAVLAGRQAMRQEAVLAVREDW
jgi:putative ABC transport system permease protein